MKSSIIAWIVLLALPIPISLFSWVATLMQIASPWMQRQPSHAIFVGLSAMILAGTYGITYIVSLVFTTMKKKIYFVSFLPIIHIALTIVLFVIAMALEI